jgi:DNA-directed RNA polymerase specialized sigma24 family protein
VATDAALRGADAAALGQLIDEHYGAMHRFARLVGRDAESSRATVRAAWLAALKRPDAQPSRVCVRAWLLQLVLQEIAPPDPPAEAEPVASPDDFEDPHGRWAGWWKDELPATTWSDAERLDDALAALPAGLTAILILRDVEQLAPDEVQLVLGYPPDLQLRLLQSARAAVRNSARKARV